MKYAIQVKIRTWDFKKNDEGNGRWMYLSRNKYKMLILRTKKTKDTILYKSWEEAIEVTKNLKWLVHRQQFSVIRIEEVPQK